MVLTNGKEYNIDVNYKNGGKVKLIHHGKYFCIVEDVENGVRWETRKNRLSEIKSEKMQIVFLSSPYSVNDKSLTEDKVNRIKAERYDEACWYAAKLRDLGYAVISPIISGVPIVERHLVDDSYDTWMEECKTLIGVSDIVVVAMMSGYDTSVGVTDERSIAVTSGKPILFASRDDDSLTLFDTVI